MHENERIRDELWAVIYGIWDYIKNSGKFESENMTLEWVGAVPGKREYRRFIGDYVLNQNDILAQRLFEDRVAFGGWSIDLHPPQGMYAQESGSKHLHMDGCYHIPFRSLYSSNVSNLLMAGRNISATHVAFGTTRVMATCAVIGEAAGTGAALCVQHAVSPRALAHDHLQQLQQTLLRQDASLLGLPNQDPLDRAREAEASASSCLDQIRIEQSDEAIGMDRHFGFLLPVNQLDRIELLLDAERPTRLETEVWSTGRAENYVPHQLEASASTDIPAGNKQWVSFHLPWLPGQAQNAFVIVKSNAAVRLHLSHRPHTGVLSFHHNEAARAAQPLEDHDVAQPVVQWSMRGLIRKAPCLRYIGTLNAYRPEQVINGFNRPYGGPNLWVSAPSDPKPWLELSWKHPVKLREIHLTFNDDVNEDLINLHHHRTDFEIIPELVKDYRLEAWIEGEWRTLHRESNNRRRKRVHRFRQPLHADRLRLTPESTNGCPRFEVVEIRVYE